MHTRMHARTVACVPTATPMASSGARACCFFFVLLENGGCVCMCVVCVWWLGGGGQQHLREKPMMMGGRVQRSGSPCIAAALTHMQTQTPTHQPVSPSILPTKPHHTNPNQPPPPLRSATQRNTTTTHHEAAQPPLGPCPPIQHHQPRSPSRRLSWKERSDASDSTL
jgi:hypothetical protein